MNICAIVMNFRMARLGTQQRWSEMTGQIDPLQRFFSHIEKQANGCWRWTASKTTDGYGYFWPTHEKNVKAHRWAYEQFVGPIPEGLNLDHLCRNRACVNPAHLEPVTVRENSRRGLNGILKPQKASRYIGVGWDSATQKWRTQIQLNGKKYTLGYFTSEEEAHQKYLNAVAAYEQNGTLPVSPLLAKKSSRYKGVYWIQQRKKWQASIRINGKLRHLGHFQTEEEAHQAYIQASQKGG